jgi:hypothetical protein
MSSRVIQTHQIGADIISLIHDAGSRVQLVSPYLALWGHLENAITDARRRNVDVSVLCRADKRDEYKPLAEKLLKLGVRFGDVKNLHAKVYVSDRACIVTSMNLYDFSATNSEEFALHSTDPQMLAEVTRYAEQLAAKAEWQRPPSTAAKLAGAVGKGIVNAASAVASLIPEGPGVCIRCGKDVQFNPDRPLCADCYQSWSKFKNPEYVEKYCHSCAKENRTSVGKPLCRRCYQRG